MNAIICLCHFCENHGPSVLFCTQPIRPKQDFESVNENYPVATQDTQLDSSTQINTQRDNEATTPQTTHKPRVKKPDTCEGCTSISGGYVTHDTEAAVSYVSKQFPPHPLIFSMVRQACVRSLSCEVCPGREGPIFFGDEERGHVLSYTFYMADSQSRGLQRWYSILVIMMDKVYLLNSWPFLVSNIQIVIDKLKAVVKKVYDFEQARCPQRPLRLQTSMTPSNFRKQRGISRAPRSLVELTNDKSIFKLLHVAFTWIIKACGSRITETILEGPPTEDSIIDMEKQEETEEGFIKLFSKKSSLSQSDDESPGQDTSDAFMQMDEASQLQSIAILRKVMMNVGYQKFRALLYHIIVGNQIICRSDSTVVLKSLISALRVLLPRGCCHVHYSDVYEESWKCNFLAVPKLVTVPKHTISIDRCLIITVELKTDYPESVNENVLNPESVLDNYNIIFNSPTDIPDKVPCVLKLMESVLQNEDFNNAVVDRSLTSIKEEWMNKVKVLFKFTKAGGSRSEEDTRRLIQVVGACSEDLNLLNFWMTGLSVQYRTHVLSASNAGFSSIV